MSTIHSAKGMEWRVVYVLNVAEGGLPSAKAETPDEIEEERRLLYVAMTRAKDGLHLIHPLRLHSVRTTTRGARAELVRRSRFLPDSILAAFAQRRHTGHDPEPCPDPDAVSTLDMPGLARALWD